MKMKTKKKLKNDQKKTSDQQSDKDSGKNSSHSVRRSSTRIQNLHKSATPSSQNSDLVDSAYDADEESVTPNFSPDQKTPLNKDPYEMDITDDVPFVKVKQRRKNNTKKAVKQIPTVKSKKTEHSPVLNPKNNPTSTPVLHGSGSSTQGQGEHALSTTPEVTPILPYKPHDCASPRDSFATPQIHRPSRKRSLQPDSLVSMSAELSYSSHGDSGIALSPMTKKPRTSSDTEKTAPQEGSNSLPSQMTKIIDNRMKKEHKPLSRVDPHKRKKKNPVSQMIVSEMHTTEQINKKHKNYSDQDSCFGFDSFESPELSTSSPASENSPPAKSKQAKRIKKTKKHIVSKDAHRSVRTLSSDSSLTCRTNERVSVDCAETSQESATKAKSKQAKRTKKTKKHIVSKDAYRSVRTLSSDSSLTCLTNKRVSLDCAETSEESVARVQSASPTLFSDSFSADTESLELEVNKTSTKAYNKSFKVRRTNKKMDLKMDEWASNFNMEIEDIEKFDLNIE